MESRGSEIGRRLFRLDISKKDKQSSVEVEDAPASDMVQRSTMLLCRHKSL